MTDPNNGSFGGGQLNRNPQTGVVTWDGSEIIIMRVKLINRLFGRVLQIRAFTTLLREAGISAGIDYAVASLLQQVPRADQHGQAIPHPNIPNGQAYLDLQAKIEQGTASAEDIQLEENLGKEIQQQIRSWAAAVMSEEQLHQIWAQMNEQDAFSGWGKAELITVNKAERTATIHVTESFIGRQAAYWTQQGFQSGTMVCSFLEGYFCGEARILLGHEEITCKEVACLHDGQSQICVFDVYPALRP